jgi:hypothetical protein
MPLVLLFFTTLMIVYLKMVIHGKNVKVKSVNSSQTSSECPHNSYLNT